MATLYSVVIAKIIFVIAVHADQNDWNSAMDLYLYEKVLNPEECKIQVSYMLDDEELRVKFMDASMRTPRGMVLTNYRDMGNYRQCLEINEILDDMTISGKYCEIQVPFFRDNLISNFPGFGPGFPWAENSWIDHNSDIPMHRHDDISVEYEQENILVKKFYENVKFGRVSAGETITLQLAICIPKVCTARETLELLNKNASLDLNVQERFCRLPNDKPWVPVDYIALVIFCTVGVLVLMSTSYDVRHTFILENDHKKINKLYQSFSAYKNANVLFTFKANAYCLSCLDGIRSLSMIWIIIGHTFVLQFTLMVENPLDEAEFMRSFSSVFITSFSISVDTFFMMSGLLLVYSSSLKFTRHGLLKSLHHFYLNRLLRMFPVLATAVLLQASLLNHVTDGPNWEVMAKCVANCRQYWWTTLLYIHNLVSYGRLCIGHSWYLGVDMQLHFLSPLVLYWILGRSKRSAWVALIGSLLVVVAGSTLYNFIMEFQSAPSALGSSAEYNRYMKMYYIHTFPRAPPFLVGMLFGYILYLYKGVKVRISMMLVVALWILTTLTCSAVIISHYFTIQPDWDNQTVDSIINSYQRPVWAAGIGWVIFACVHGYSGPINWFLSLSVFKFLARLSYALYVFHLPIIFALFSTTLQPIYFTPEFTIHKFMTVFNYTLIASMLVTIFIDMPFSNVVDILFPRLKGNKKNFFTDNVRSMASNESKAAY